MSHAMMALLAAGGATTPKLYAEDVFSAYTYTGNGATQTIVNGVDLATKGGSVWVKRMSSTESHRVCSTAGNSYAFGLALQTNSTNRTMDGTLSTFNSDGFYLNGTTYGNTGYNTNAEPYISWTFRNANKFYTHAIVVKSGGSNAVVDLSTLGTVGMVRVVRADATGGSWYVWHRSLTPGKLLIGESTAAEATLGHITVSGTTLTLVNGVIADGTYHVEAYAHDTSINGLIQCGLATNAVSGVPVVLGFEPQYVLFKSISSTDGWRILDSSRPRSLHAKNGIQAYYLEPNTSAAEGALGADTWNINANGFTATFGTDTIYMAIRRPNKPPTSGTQVYKAIARNGTSAPANVTGLGFNPDLMFSTDRNNAYANNSTLVDKLRGGTSNLLTSSLQAENVYGAVTSFNPDGYSLNSDGVLLSSNTSGRTYIQQCFKRAPGFFDEVCYTGVGSATTVTHNLGVVPELMIVKRRDADQHWAVYVASVGNTGAMFLSQTNTPSTSINYWNSTTPTATVFSVGASANTGATGTYVAYLFATLAGISKVFSYTGNGTSQTIACGFAAGARFILIKRTDSTGDWFIWDTVRGIVAGNDPHLSLNTTAAEVTSDDSIDPDSSGFIVNQLSATNINVTSATYIGLAIA